MTAKHFIVLCGLSAALLIGCAKNSNTTATDSHVTEAAHHHDGWWCDEHGVPEEVCALCNTKLVAEFKAKNDWCDKHDRPDSQCFVCHPERETEFAAQYEAKYGKQPPKRHEEVAQRQTP